jgi:hypothetical protein
MQLFKIPDSVCDGHICRTLLTPRMLPHSLQARMLALLGRLLELPLNLDCLLTSGPLLPSFAKATLHALDHCNSLEADEPSMTIGGEASSRLSMLLQVRLDTCGQ